jgi:hypothetical protein
MTTVIARLVLVYVIGVVALAVGFYEFWQRGVINMNAFLIGSTCLVSAAAIQVARSLWLQFRR